MSSPLTVFSHWDPFFLPPVLNYDCEELCLCSICVFMEWCLGTMILCCKSRQPNVLLHAQRLTAIVEYTNMFLTSSQNKV
jgi:hypothetical protein